jgi:hypothetical protein
MDHDIEKDHLGRYFHTNRIFYHTQLIVHDSFPSFSMFDEQFTQMER